MKNSLIKLTAVMAVFIILAGVVDNRIRPVIKSLAQSQAIVLSTSLIDNAVMEIIEDEKIEYSYFVDISTGENDKVTSIQANTLHINSLKAKISKNISEKISAIEGKVLSIPIGTLIGNNLFAGRGPKITFHITLTGNVITEIVSSFRSSGINQTLHTISIDINASIIVVCPGYNTATTTQTNIAVAQSVIVGEVPSTYNYISANLDEYTANYPTMD